MPVFPKQQFITKTEKQEYTWRGSELVIMMWVFFMFSVGRVRGDERWWIF